jgi:hypothetical protein
MLQAGRSSVRAPNEVDFFFNLPNTSKPHYDSGVDSASNRKSTRNLPGGKKQPARRADNLTAICEPNV